MPQQLGNLATSHCNAAVAQLCKTVRILNGDNVAILVPLNKKIQRFSLAPVKTHAIRDAMVCRLRDMFEYTYIVDDLKRRCSVTYIYSVVILRRIVTINCYASRFADPRDVGICSVRFNWPGFY